MSESDATPAYRGYRLQALYVMNRILTSDDYLIFTPEGIEDLSVTEGGKTIEIVQVKSYDGLVLSDLGPSKANSFFHRVIPSLKNRDDNLDVSIVNFGQIGPELLGAWNGEEKHQESVRKKLKENGFEDNEINSFFDGVHLLRFDEVKLQKEVDDRIRELLPGVDSQHVFDILQTWLYDLSENRSSVSQSELIEKIQKVGKFLNDRIQYHSEWFTNITPLKAGNLTAEHENRLRDEFYAGVSTRYEHILAGLDFLRPSKMDEIKQGFATGNIVIVHGASGQGKSTLAFRYLHENYPEQLRYQIHMIEDRSHALKVTRALSGYAEALGTKIVVYFDVNPRDQGWAELLSQLAEHPYIQILVTVREEDFNRANISFATQFVDVSLELYKAEAAQLYQRAQHKNFAVDFLSFENAWDEFGGEGGPLLEFVYLLTQTKTLFQRLDEQVNRLKREVRDKNLSPDELELLKLVSIVTAYEGKVDLQKLIPQLQLPEPSTTLKYFEKEYLLRVSANQQFLEALHPIRSNILVELLVDPDIDSWVDLIEKAIVITPENDWEIFLLKTYVNHQKIFNELILVTKNLSPESWVGVASVMRCLLWVGIKIYIEKNRKVIDRAKNVMGKELFWMVMDLNFIDSKAEYLDRWWEALGDVIPQEKRDEIIKIREEQSPKEEVYKLAANWLSEQNAPNVQPQEWRDWQVASEVLYWASRFQLGEKISHWLHTESIVIGLEVLDLQDFSKVLFSIFNCVSFRYQEVIENIGGDLKLRLAREFKVFVLDEQENALTLHFIAYPEETQNLNEESILKNKIHNETMLRVEMVRKLFPGFEYYGSKGYGHKIPGLEILSDETIKNIPVYRLPPEWPVKLNSLAAGVIKNEMRLDTWDEYLNQVLEIRQFNVRNLELLCQRINRFFQKTKVENFLDIHPFSTQDWEKGAALLSDLPKLPKASTDPWGIGQPEGDSKIGNEEDEHSKTSLSKARSPILQKKYRDYLDAERDCLFKLSTFYGQSQHVMVLNIRCGKEPENSPQQLAVIAELTEKGVVLQNRFLSKINIWEAYEHLISYQLEFRKLFREKIEPEILTALENKERDVFERLLWTWFIFVDNPRTSLSNSKKQILQRVANTYEGILFKIEKTIASSQFNFGNTRILNKNLDWESFPAVWIQLDVKSSLKLGKKLDELLYALRSDFGTSQYGDYLYSLIEAKLRYVVIVPTVQGKSVDAKAYPLRTTLVFMQDHKIEEKPYLYAPQELQEDTLASLGVCKWDFENIREINDLETSYSILMVKLTLIAQLAELPSVPEELMPEFQSYISEKATEITEPLQTFIESKEMFFNYLENLPQDDILANETLTEAKKALSVIDDILLIDDQGKLELSIPQLKDYSEALQEILQVILGLKFIWLNALLEREEFESRDTPDKS